MFRKVTNKLSKGGGLLLAVMLAAIVGGATTAIVTAAIPSSNGTISACYGKINGNLRVIDAESGKTCNGLENPLSWSSSGGNTQTVSNVVSLPVGGTGGNQVLLNVPGYGELVAVADTCQDQGLVSLNYVNTTSSVVRLGLNNYGYGATVNPGQSFGLTYNSSPLQIEVAGNASKLTTVSFNLTGDQDSNGNFTDCNAFAQSFTVE